MQYMRDRSGLECPKFYKSVGYPPNDERSVLHIHQDLLEELPAHAARGLLRDFGGPRAKR